jgi:hypothetical protein
MPTEDIQKIAKLAAYGIVDETNLYKNLGQYALSGEADEVIN